MPKEFSLLVVVALTFESDTIEMELLLCDTAIP